MTKKKAPENKDLAFMKNPAEWPRWPFLPVKRYDGDRRLETGYMLAVETKLTSVHLGYVFMPSKDDKELKYESYEAIVEAGWVVD